MTICDQRIGIFRRNKNYNFSIVEVKQTEFERNQKNKKKQTKIHSHSEVTRILLSFGRSEENLTNKKPKCDQSSLMYMCKYGWKST